MSAAAASSSSSTPTKVSVLLSSHAKGHKRARTGEGDEDQPSFEDLKLLVSAGLTTHKSLEAFFRTQDFAEDVGFILAMNLLLHGSIRSTLKTKVFVSCYAPEDVTVRDSKELNIIGYKLTDELQALAEPTYETLAHERMSHVIGSTSAPVIFALPHFSIIETDKEVALVFRLQTVKREKAHIIKIATLFPLARAFFTHSLPNVEIPSIQIFANIFLDLFKISQPDSIEKATTTLKEMVKEDQTIDLTKLTAFIEGSEGAASVGSTFLVRIFPFLVAGLDYVKKAQLVHHIYMKAGSKAAAATYIQLRLPMIFSSKQAKNLKVNEQGLDVPLLKLNALTKKVGVLCSTQAPAIGVIADYFDNIGSLEFPTHSTKKDSPDLFEPVKGTKGGNSYRKRTLESLNLQVVPGEVFQTMFQAIVVKEEGQIATSSSSSEAASSSSMKALNLFG